MELTSYIIQIGGQIYSATHGKGSTNHGHELRPTSTSPKKKKKNRKKREIKVMGQFFYRLSLILNALLWIKSTHIYPNLKYQFMPTSSMFGRCHEYTILVYPNLLYAYAHTHTQKRSNNWYNISYKLHVHLELYIS